MQYENSSHAVEVYFPNWSTHDHQNFENMKKFSLNFRNLLCISGIYETFQKFIENSTNFLCILEIHGAFQAFSGHFTYFLCISIIFWYILNIFKPVVLYSAEMVKKRFSKRLFSLYECLMKRIWELILFEIILKCISTDFIWTVLAQMLVENKLETRGQIFWKEEIHIDFLSSIVQGVLKKNEACCRARMDCSIN